VENLIRPPLALIAATPQASSTQIFGSPEVPWVSCRCIGITIWIYVCVILMVATSFAHCGARKTGQERPKSERTRDFRISLKSFIPQVLIDQIKGSVISKMSMSDHRFPDEV